MKTQLFKHLRLEILTRQCDTSICFKMSSMKRRMMLLEFETCNFHLPSLLYVSTFQSRGKNLWGRYWEKKMWTKISGLSITDGKAHQAVHVIVENKTACVLCSKIPWRRKICSQGEGQQLAGQHLAKVKTLGRNSQVLYLHSSQLFSQLTSKLEINSGEPKYACWLLQVQVETSDYKIHPQMQEIWGYIRKYIVEKIQINATNVILPLLRDTVWGHIRKHIGRKVKQMQPM